MQGKRSPCLLYPVLRSNGEWRVGNWGARENGGKIQREKVEGKSGVYSTPGVRLGSVLWGVYFGDCTFRIPVGCCTLGVLWGDIFHMLRGTKMGALHMLRETKAGATFASGFNVLQPG